MSNATEVINTYQGEDGKYLPLSIEQNERISRGFIPKIMKVIARVPFADDLAAAYYAARDPRTPAKAKAVLFAAIAYFVLPADAVPDVIVGLGFADDATVLATALSVVGSQIKERHRRAARRLLGLAEPIKSKDD